MNRSILVLAFLSVTVLQARAQEGRPFADPVLSDLIDKGLAFSPDVKNAVSRVDEARVRVRVAESFLKPTVRGNPLVQTQSLSPNRPVQFANVNVQRVQVSTFQIPVDASFELDFFKRLRQGVQLAQIQTQVSEADVRIARLAIASEIARVYALVRANDAEQQVFTRTLSSRDSVLAVVRERFRIGLTSEMDVRRAETEIAGLKTQQTALQRSRHELTNGLAILTGQDVGAYSLTPATLPEYATPTYENITVDLLRSRPDIQQSDLLTNAADVQVGIARTALKPRINLLGSGGLQSGTIEKVLYPTSYTYTVGAGASFPIYEGKRNRENINLARQQVQTAKLAVDQKVVTAQREAEVALDNIRDLETQLTNQQAVIQSARQTERLVREVYAKGLTTYLDVLDAQRTTIDAERQLVQLQGQRLVYAVALWKSLGGK
ncbi:efflux transporter outer membrane subunit [Siphonobacter aquaeclarae]|jgi:multidrug efflux system outer membrane protein|uniref:Outer membrane protein, multidrug efflux system n=1 Tax=Siphonobacter aquaeclarae TaxID=563176 RepID=A0A1G9UFS2_9BACT|nr:efflux transporter outer membrane subunit [Siphonobacter aquaeclarae]SDM58673.1 outer membrane protein, multidrug efflux system [Siphonobacter aquaeclarae]